MGLSLALLLGSACGTKLGEQCYFGCEQECYDTGKYVVCVCRPQVVGCAEGLYCSFTTNNCETPSQRGEPCGEQCAEGLDCRFDGVCGGLGAEGDSCAEDQHCAAGLRCNWGTEPLTRSNYGRCMPVQGEGGPCTWYLWPKSQHGQLTVHGLGMRDSNCGPDLICQPNEAGPDPASYTTENATRACEGGCGYPGTCRLPASAELGEPCSDSRTCRSGRCYVPPIPWVLPCRDSATGALTWYPRESCYEAPVTGACVAADTPLEKEKCGAPGMKPCAPGLACSTNDVCYGRFARGDTASCGRSSFGATEAEACGIGLTCALVEGSWQCRR